MSGAVIIHIANTHHIAISDATALHDAHVARRCSCPAVACPAAVSRRILLQSPQPQRQHVAPQQK